MSILHVLFTAARASGSHTALVGVASFTAVTAAIVDYAAQGMPVAPRCDGRFLAVGRARVLHWER